MAAVLLPCISGVLQGCNRQINGILSDIVCDMHRFKAYGGMCKAKLFPKYSAVEHWAKIEPAELSSRDLRRLQTRIANRYPVEAFNSVRRQLDPKQILCNEWVDALIPSI